MIAFAETMKDVAEKDTKGVNIEFNHHNFNQNKLAIRVDSHINKDKGRLEIFFNDKKAILNKVEMKHIT